MTGSSTSRDPSETTEIKQCMHRRQLERQPGYRCLTHLSHSPDNHCRQAPDTCSSTNGPYSSWNHDDPASRKLRCLRWKLGRRPLTTTKPQNPHAQAHTGRGRAALPASGVTSSATKPGLTATTAAMAIGCARAMSPRQPRGLVSPAQCRYAGILGPSRVQEAQHHRRRCSPRRSRRPG